MGNDDWDFRGRADLMISGDTGKLGLWQGGGTYLRRGKIAKVWLVLGSKTLDTGRSSWTV